MTTSNITILNLTWASIAATYYAHQGLTSLAAYRVSKLKGAIYNTLMCFSIFIVCILTYISLSPSIAFIKSITGLSAIFLVLSYFLYIKIMRKFIVTKHTKLLKFCSNLLLFLAVIYLLIWLAFIFTGENLMYNFSSDLATAGNAAAKPSLILKKSLFSRAVVFYHFLVTFITAILCAFVLFTSKKKDKFLIAGLGLSAIAGIYDPCVAYLKITGVIFPLTFVGMVLEAYRFTSYYLKYSYQTVDKLQAEMNELSKIANFGFAAGSIAHDIRNPLTVISGICEKIKLNMTTNVSPNDTKKEIEKVSRQVKVMTDITSSYMNILNESSHTETVLIKFSELSERIDEIIPSKRRYNVPLEYIYESDASIECNPSEVAICITNLLLNAVDAVKNSNTPWVRVEFNSINDDFEIKVIDSGNGIPADIVDQIFDFQFSTKKTTGGTGVGLAISQTILNKSGFHLSLDSHCVNTCFVIRGPKCKTNRNKTSL